MITVRQMERLWDARQHNRLIAELMENRPEGSAALRLRIAGALPAAALALVRLEELDQAHVPLAQKLVRCVLASQSGADGGWSDPLLTSMCVRALSTARGQGVALERGVHYLAGLQKSDGAWPREPIRRLAADAYVTAFVVYQLGRVGVFRSAVRIDDALAWLRANVSGASVEPEAHRLAQIIAIREAVPQRPRFAGASDALLLAAVHG